MPISHYTIAVPLAPLSLYISLICCINYTSHGMVFPENQLIYLYKGGTMSYKISLSEEKIKFFNTVLRSILSLDIQRKKSAIQILLTLDALHSNLDSHSAQKISDKMFDIFGGKRFCSKDVSAMVVFLQGASFTASSCGPLYKNTELGCEFVEWLKKFGTNDPIAQDLLQLIDL